MKKILLAVFVLFLTACNNDDETSFPTPDPERFIRKDAANTTIPLVMYTSWKYRKEMGDAEKPDKLIRNLLLNDHIVEMKILPVRHYDNNDGSGSYEYQTLCYITENQLVYFYMGDKILIGRYLYPDNYGFESVIWDFELPTYYSENSERDFLLNRAISDPNVNRNENFLRESSKFHTIDIEINAVNVKRYRDCKLFIYDNQRVNAEEAVRANYFYFKDGVGLVRYQQFVKVNDTLVLLYEQNLIEEP